MGVKRLMDFGDRGFGWAASLDQPMLCIFKPYDGHPATVGNGVMAGISVDSRETVDRVHKKALELGGVDEGLPGLRAIGGDGFYAAYFRDLDGNKLDVFCLRLSTNGGLTLHSADAASWRGFIQTPGTMKSMTAQSFSQWLAQYGRAWETEVPKGCLNCSPVVRSTSRHPLLHQ